VFDATSISINSAPMSSSGNVKLRYEKCLQVWGNAKFVELHPNLTQDLHRILTHPI